MCEHCGMAIEAARSTKRFCSDICRIRAHHRRAREASVNSVLTEYLIVGRESHPTVARPGHPPKNRYDGRSSGSVLHQEWGPLMWCSSSLTLILVFRA